MLRRFPSYDPARMSRQNLAEQSEFPVLASSEFLALKLDFSHFHRIPISKNWKAARVPSCSVHASIEYAETSSSLRGASRLLHSHLAIHPRLATAPELGRAPRSPDRFEISPELTVLIEFPQTSNDSHQNMPCLLPQLKGKAQDPSRVTLPSKRSPRAAFAKQFLLQLFLSSELHRLCQMSPLLTTTTTTVPRKARLHQPIPIPFSSLPPS